MNRSNYIGPDDDLDPTVWLWRGAVIKAINGKRGQALLRDLLAALDAMPEKRLIEDNLICEGEVCALGALGLSRGMGEDLNALDPEDSEAVAKAFGVAPALVREIAYKNDGGSYATTPEERWAYMRAWVKRKILPASTVEVGR